MAELMGNWVRQARCAQNEPGIDARDFQVPLRGDSQNKAKLFCVGCPVQMECLAWALNNSEIWGVWGGLDEAEIRKALSVDASGKYVRRCRPPGCPNPRCRARPSALQLLGTGKRAVIKCGTCEFSWKSPTSVTALQHYQRTRRTIERRRTRARRVQLEQAPTVSNVVSLPSRPEPVEGQDFVLVASVAGGRVNG